MLHQVRTLLQVPTSHDTQHLTQSLEAKHDVPTQPLNTTHASVSLQALVRMYRHVCGMTVRCRRCAVYGWGSLRTVSMALAHTPSIAQPCLATRPHWVCLCWVCCSHPAVTLLHDTHILRVAHPVAPQGTASPAAAELDTLYGLSVVRIPPNRPLQRHDAPTVLFRSFPAKLQWLLRTVQAAQAVGQPVLLGTSSVTESEVLNCYLSQAVQLDDATIWKGCGGGMPAGGLNTTNHPAW